MFQGSGSMTGKLVQDQRDWAAEGTASPQNQVAGRKGGQAEF
jgi:hypothetical protein